MDTGQDIFVRRALKDLPYVSFSRVPRGDSGQVVDISLLFLSSLSRCLLLEDLAIASGRE
jgi:hypothetical protein